MRRKQVSFTPPYVKLAYVYDYLMAHVDYDGWADYIHSLMERFGNGGSSILDAGCGTGRHVRRLRQHGYDLVGFDISMEMAGLSALKRTGRVWQGDMRQMAVKASSDAILCLYDTIHYLKESELPVFFKQCCQALKPYGLLIFDAVTESFLREYWSDYTERDRYDGWTIFRRSWYDPKKHVQHTYIELVHQDGEKTYSERHTQRSFKIRELQRLGIQSGFELAAVLDSFTYEPGDEHTGRNHFIFKRRPH